MKIENIAKYIDHTALKADTSFENIKKLCMEAAQYGFASVCVNPSFIPMCAELLKNSEAKVCTVVGFPLGANTTESKVFETEDAIKKGAQEVDMVINITRLKEADYDYVENEIRQIADVCRNNKVISKVIIETCLLTNEEKTKVCELVVKAGADFVKTSTGFSTGGATVEDIKLMNLATGGKIGIKASGGIRDLETALQMIEAGATRIGASAGIKIVQEFLA